MKRKIAILLTLALLLCAVPVSASASTEYVFSYDSELMECLSMPGKLPEGLYSVSLLQNGQDIVFPGSIILVSYEQDPYDPGSFVSLSGLCTLDLEFCSVRFQEFSGDDHLITSGVLSVSADFTGPYEPLDVYNGLELKLTPIEPTSSSSYVSSYIEEFNIPAIDGQVPSGTYNIYLAVPLDNCVSIIQICSNHLVQYTSFVGSFGTVDVAVLPCLFGIWGEDVYLSFSDGVSTLAVLEDSLPYAIEGNYTFIFEPVNASALPSLSEIIPADSLAPAFNEIVALLPVALITLVSFIAIRKGIRFLQDNLHKT